VALRDICIWPGNFLGYHYYKLFKSSRSFEFQGNSFDYFYHRYNATYRCERAVEVPIVWQMVEQYQHKRVLEVGNVLANYFYTDHDILDKYKKIDGVINQDVVDFRVSGSYDLIVSISTLEHVGWDEAPRHPTKIIDAIENLKNCLAPGGKLVVTLPLGYNSAMDSLLKTKKLQFDQQYYLKRISADNQWRQVDWPDVAELSYNQPYPHANGLLIGIIDK